LNFASKGKFFHYQHFDVFVKPKKEREDFITTSLTTIIIQKPIGLVEQLIVNV
jgi:hypothetical protein